MRRTLGLILLTACAGNKRAMQPIDAFTPPPALVYCRSKTPVEAELIAPLACGNRERRWEGTWKDGSFTWQCRAGSEIAAQLNVALADSGCVADLERYRVQDGIVTTVRKKGRWREAFSRKLPCHEEAALCLVDGYELDRPELSIRGAFDEDSRPTGPWTLTAEGATKTIEFKAGTGALENFGVVKKLSCTAGYVTGEFTASLPRGTETVELASFHDRGVRQGLFRVWSTSGTELEGRYEHGVPSGPWKISARLVSMPTTAAMVDAACKGECVVAGADPQPADRQDGGTMVPTTSLLVAPGFPLMPFRCHEALFEAVGAPAEWVISRFSLPPTQAFGEARRVARLAASAP